MTDQTTVEAAAAAYEALVLHPSRTWRGSCNPTRHGSDESWTVEAKTEYGAAVKLRAQLRTEGRVMPADLDWSSQP